MNALREALARRLFLPGALAVFTASGFAGLIYESIWSHYLRLFLGHAAYAQTLVLAIFMGGMAVGAWAASRISLRVRDLLLAYALVEAAIGIVALAFHRVFVDATGVAFEQVIPALGSPIAVHAFKWALGAALILPQSVLLGMTFPLMTGGVLRLCVGKTGYAVAMLYFANSLGAAIGVLASGFYFIAAVGLPGTLVAAAAVNLAVAAAVFLLPGRSALAPAPARGAGGSAGAPQLRLLLGVAALTGTSSFMYEIGWIRMLALVLGSSTHAFELMLSAFIFGIAFGGLWVRRRIDAAADSVGLLAWVQIAMGLAALATLPIYGSTFRAMEAVLGALARSETGYWAFNIASHALCLVIMLPAAFCAGMTLPLITASLLRQGAGERALGQVYAANTAGAIVGVLLAVHVGFIVLGLKGLIIAGAAIDLTLGVVLLARGPMRAMQRYASAGAAALAVAAVAGTAAFVELDAHLMASGVYRDGRLLPAGQVVHLQRDGKTATVSLTGDPSGAGFSLRTNGKVDGSVRLDGGPPAEDEITMTFTGALPLLLAPGARRVANIGFGTGMTSHVLLASPSIERVDTIEIEPVMVEAALRLRRVNWRSLEDPRSRIVYEDAKTYFAAQAERYDVIVSEPSNPWVSGVASLFSIEFYHDVRRYLRDRGLFVQWVQLYEITPELLGTVISALDANFSDYEFWLANSGDLVIVAVPSGRVPAPDARAFALPQLRAELARFGIGNLDELALHRVAGRAALAPYFLAFGTRPNSDYFPVLEMKAPLARFMGSATRDLLLLTQAPFPVLRLFDERARRSPDPARLSTLPRPWTARADWIRRADAMRRYVDGGDERALAQLGVELGVNLAVLRAALSECKLQLPGDALARQFAGLASMASAYLPTESAVTLWDELVSPRCRARLSAADRRWLLLHRAVASGKAQEFGRAAETILQADPELNGVLLAHALSAYMASKIVAGQAPEALTAYQARRGRLGSVAREWDPVFRFLLAQAYAG